MVQFIVKVFDSDAVHAKVMLIVKPQLPKGPLPSHCINDGFHTIAMDAAPAKQLQGFIADGARVTNRVVGTLLHPHIDSREILLFTDIETGEADCETDGDDDEEED